MGGQTALNCALDLADAGVLDAYQVELIGASREAIRMAEDRELFRNAMAEIGLECPKAEVARSFEQALDIQSRVGYPYIIRPSFTLRSEEHTSELQSLMCNSYAVHCLTTKNKSKTIS